MAFNELIQRAVVLLVLMWLALAAPKAQTHLTIDIPSQEAVVFNITNALYGTLEFDGSLERVDMNTEWEFRAHLFATFHVGATHNRTERVDLAALRFVATNPRPDRPNGPADLVFKHDAPIEVHLRMDGDRRAIPDVVFRVPKQAVAGAAFTGLSVRSGGLVWPIPGLARLTESPPDRPQP